MLPHIKTLSLWEIANYWHGCDPRLSQTHRLPLKVRDTLLVFAMEFGSSLNLRVEQDKSYLLNVIKKAPQIPARHYRQTFKKAIDNKVFGKRFFSKMYLTRSQLAMQQRMQSKTGLSNSSVKKVKPFLARRQPLSISLTRSLKRKNNYSSQIWKQPFAPCLQPCAVTKGRSNNYVRMQA